MPLRTAAFVTNAHMSVFLDPNKLSLCVLWATIWGDLHSPVIFSLPIVNRKLNHLQACLGISLLTNQPSILEQMTWMHENSPDPDLAVVDSQSGTLPLLHHLELVHASKTHFTSKDLSKAI